MAVALLGLAVGGVQLGGAARATGRGEEGAPAVKVVTFSTFHANPRPQALRDTIVAEKPDIVLLQETDGNARDVVLKLLPRYHRIKQCPWRYCHLVILSRWPIRRMDVPFPRHGARPSVLMGEVEAPFRRFRVIDVHLPRPYKPEAEPAMQALAEVARAASGRPLIMTGDFNAASGSFGLARFAERSRLIRREGFIPTYPANRLAPAFAGIDHVFADSRWSGGDCRRLAAAHSDHYGVACTLRLRAGG
jgi:endonuclease/exonuclease/phosphatase (EEP) superfamily protein YafD